MKLNLGSNSKKENGYLNVDALKLPNVDFVHDLTSFPYPWGDETVSDVLLVEVLEHISFRYTQQVLKEIYRILEQGGRLHVQVPDCGSMMRAYVHGEICDCVEHKPIDDTEGYGKPLCPKCHGKAIVNPNRWLYAFLGAQKHFPHDVHKNIFTAERLGNLLDEAGFAWECIMDKRGWKLKFNAYKI